MPARMKNPAMLVPDAMQAIVKLNQATRNGAVPGATLELAHLRASQINGCSSCVDAGSRQAKGAGETDERRKTIESTESSPSGGARLIVGWWLRVDEFYARWPSDSL